MALREALVPMTTGEDVAVYLRRALDAAATQGGSGRLRLELGSAFLFGDNAPPGPHVGVSLWVERGTGRTESWQRVTPTIVDASYAAVLDVLGRHLDAARA